MSGFYSIDGGERLAWNGSRFAGAPVESFYLTHRDRLMFELRQIEGYEEKPIKFVTIVPDEVGDGANVYIHYAPRREHENHNR